MPEVDLSDNNLGDYGARAIADMLKENSTLVNLNLSGNNFTDRSAEHISPALITNTKLQHLDLSHNALGERAGRVALTIPNSTNGSHFYQDDIKYNKYNTGDSYLRSTR